jgi:DNA-directed RNA polymerase subunit K/omega
MYIIYIYILYVEFMFKSELSEFVARGLVNSVLTFGKSADPTKKSPKYMNIFEVAHLIGVRAEQLENGSTPVVDIRDMTFAQDIAEAEFEEKHKFPLKLIRKNLNNEDEEWDISDMTFVE